MNEMISNIFDIALSPFTGMYSFVIIPFGFIFALGAVSLLFALMRRF